MEAVAGGASVAVKRGGDGAVLETRGVRYQATPPAQQVVDTTGAGDCFCGSLAARLSEDAELGQALQWANAAAALSTERAGAVPSMPTRAEIEAALAGSV